jgi:hypothetical protein
MESVDNKGEIKNPDTQPIQGIYSKVIRAGKRTYFFDVKSTRNDEYYLTITESKKKFLENGNFRYEKHKLFLYPEDFEKFTESLREVLAYIGINQPESENQPEAGAESEKVSVESELTGKNFSSIDFEDI